ncbi:MAG: DUF3043 domain-containing protein [Actinomycetaceae bacterium]|nr:DUF3043 domain-containing protein [Arcanobacterium sp.]MDD7686333.1 DUF3043 domain-containing protein [Actinomycetaceae bacterium]MDY5274192.1 DUF3043 domain-containing protein [Arcanobacterium sp.]
MFGLKKRESATTPVETTTEVTLPKGYTPKKGGATPKRREVEASNRRPLVADKTKLTRAEKKERKAQARQRSDALWQQQQEAMRTGDEAHMPYQHRGKARRFARDYVDASAPISAWFMPMAILLIPLMFFSAAFPVFAFTATICFYAVFLLMLLHALFVAFRAKHLAQAKFGEAAVPRGLVWQMIGRCFYVRRWRLPKPQVARGEFPEGGTRADVTRMRQEKRRQRKERKHSGV